MRFSTIFLDEYKECLEIVLKNSDWVEGYLKESNIKSDVEECISSQDGPYYNLEIPKYHTKTGNPEVFVFKVETIENDDEFIYEITV